MDAQIRAFFNRLYQILGIDTQEKRNKLLFQFEDTVVRRAMARFMADLTPQDQSHYEEFLRAHPQATSEEVSAFLRALRPGFDFAALFNDEARILTEAYVKKVLTTATEDQKQQIKAMFQEMFHLGKP